ncbi:MAG: RadC family protein [Oscillospiraceae bacterium]|nr:RadC family protein [Oscillospiraceae bacterium]
MSMHDGHRQRLKSRFLQEGLDHFEEKHALELLLFYCVPRKDTSPLAYRLIDHFKSFDAVLDATPKELMEVDGVGENVAAFLSLLKSSWGYYGIVKNKKQKILSTIKECAEYLQHYFVSKSVETVYLLCLDAKGKALCCKMIGEGSVNSASVSIRKIVETAINANATTVVLAHNHPSGLAVPSGEDIQTTQRLVKALEAVEIILADHLVFAEGEYVSIVQSRGYSFRNLIDAGDTQ